MYSCPNCGNKLTTLRVKPAVRSSGIIEKYIIRVRGCKTIKGRDRQTESKGCGWQGNTVEIPLEALRAISTQINKLII
jgi:hypothetical protein